MDNSDENALQRKQGRDDAAASEDDGAPSLMNNATAASPLAAHFPLPSQGSPRAMRRRAGGGGGDGKKHESRSSAKQARCAATTSTSLCSPVRSISSFTFNSSVAAAGSVGCACPLPIKKMKKVKPFCKAEKWYPQWHRSRRHAAYTSSLNIFDEDGKDKGGGGGRASSSPGISPAVASSGGVHGGSNGEDTLAHIREWYFTLLRPRRARLQDRYIDKEVAQEAARRVRSQRKKMEEEEKEKDAMKKDRVELDCCPPHHRPYDNTACLLSSASSAQDKRRRAKTTYVEASEQQVGLLESSRNVGRESPAPAPHDEFRNHQLTFKEAAKIGFMMLLVLNGAAMQVIFLNFWLRQYPADGAPGNYTTLAVSSVMFSLFFLITLAIHLVLDRPNLRFARNWYGFRHLAYVGIADTFCSAMTIYGASHTSEVLQALFTSLVPVFTAGLQKRILRDPRELHNFWVACSFACIVLGVIVAASYGVLHPAQEDDSSGGGRRRISHASKVVWNVLFACSVIPSVVQNVFQTKYMISFTKDPLFERWVLGKVTREEVAAQGGGGGEEEEACRVGRGGGGDRGECSLVEGDAAGLANDQDQSAASGTVVSSLGHKNENKTSIVTATLPHTVSMSTRTSTTTPLPIFQQGLQQRDERLLLSESVSGGFSPLHSSRYGTLSSRGHEEAERGSVSSKSLSAPPPILVIDDDRGSNGKDYKKAKRRNKGGKKLQLADGEEGSRGGWHLSTCPMASSGGGGGGDSVKGIQGKEKGSTRKKKREVKRAILDDFAASAAEGDQSAVAVMFSDAQGRSAVAAITNRSSDKNDDNEGDSDGDTYSNSSSSSSCMYSVRCAGAHLRVEYSVAQGDDLTVKLVLLATDTTIQAILALLLFPADALPWWGGSTSIAASWENLHSGVQCLLHCENNLLFCCLYCMGFVCTYVGAAYLDQYNVTLCSMVSQLAAPATALLLLLVPQLNLSGDFTPWYYSLIAILLLSTGALLYTSWDQRTMALREEGENQLKAAYVKPRVVLIESDEDEEGDDDMKEEDSRANVRGGDEDDEEVVVVG